MDPNEWLKALAGRGDADRDSESAELRALRETLRQREQGHPRDEPGLDALFARLEREGLLEPRHRGPRSNWWPAAAAASLAAVVGATALFMVGGEDPELIRYRGLGEPVELQVPQPAAWVGAMERELDDAACAHQRAGEDPLVLVVDAPEHCLAVLNERLAAHDIQVGDPGRYRLRVIRPDSPTAD